MTFCPPCLSHRGRRVSSRTSPRQARRTVAVKVRTPMPVAQRGMELPACHRHDSVPPDTSFLPLPFGRPSPRLPSTFRSSST